MSVRQVFKGIRATAGVVIGLLLLTGCVGFKIQDSPKFDKDEPNEEQWLLNVPFYSDNTDQCGPAALASVLSFWGYSTDPPALKNEIYLAHLKGSLALDLMLAAQNRGFQTKFYSGNIDDLRNQLRKGYPLIAFINRGFDFFPIGHYVVVTGFDDVRQGLILHSGMTENKFVQYKSFLKSWNKTQRSTLLIFASRYNEVSSHGKK